MRPRHPSPVPRFGWSALSALLLAATIAPSASAATRLKGPEVIPFDAIMGHATDLAAGDIDQDGVPEILGSFQDRALRVWKRDAGRWNMAFIASAGIGPELYGTPFVSYTDEPAVSPGGGYRTGQFLYAAHTPAPEVWSIRMDLGGVFSDASLTGALVDIPMNGPFSNPGTLPANGDPTPRWRLLVPGGSIFDPPMFVYLPEFGTTQPFPKMTYSTDLSGYCEQASHFVGGSAIGDFNGDGTNEAALLVHANVWLTSTFSAGAGGGNSGCWGYQRVPVGGVSGNQQMFVGRFDGNSTDDLIVRELDGTVRVLLGQPGGPPYAFTTNVVPTAATGSPNASDIASADLDGDGDLDFVVSFLSPPGYEVAINMGSGSFSTTFVALGGPNLGARSVAIADFDGDLLLDLALSQPNTVPARLLLLPGDGLGSFANTTTYGLGSLEAACIIATDLSADGIADVAVGGTDVNFTFPSYPIRTFTGQMGGGLLQTTPSAADDVLFGPVERMTPFRPSPTGPLQLAMASDNFMASSTVNPDGSLQDWSALYVYQVTGFDVADMDDDGSTDHARLLFDSFANTTAVHVDHALGATDFTVSGARQGLIAVDWNSDGRLDLATLNIDTNALEIWFMDPAPNFTFGDSASVPLAVTLETYPSLFPPPFALRPFGASDPLRLIAVRSGDVFGFKLVQCVRNDLSTNGVFVFPFSSSTASGLTWGDVNDDNVPDLLVSYSSPDEYGTVSVLRGTASPPYLLDYDATFIWPATRLADIAAGDVTGDGHDDLVVVTPGTVLTSATRSRPGPPNRIAASAGLAVLPAVPTSPGTGGVDDGPAPSVAPSRLALAIAPNPVRGGTSRLTFDLPLAADVRAELVDLAGRRLRTLVRGPLGAGRHERVLTLADDGGRPLAAGVYFVSVRAGSERGVKRLVVLP